jgi:predicted nucleic acid-binding protein
VNSICLAAFRREITTAACEGALGDLAADLDEGRLVLVDLPWRKAFGDAAELSAAHTPRLGTRTLDVLHVASAKLLGSRAFVTYDDRQALLAKAVGLRVARP